MSYLVNGNEKGIAKGQLLGRIHQCQELLKQEPTPEAKLLAMNQEELEALLAELHKSFCPMEVDARRVALLWQQQHPVDSRIKVLQSCTPLDSAPLTPNNKGAPPPWREQRRGMMGDILRRLFARTHG